MTSWARLHHEITSNVISIPRLAELPLQAGGVIAVNPAFVLSVTPLTASTTQVVPAGKGPQVIALSYDDVITALGGTI